MTAHERRPGGSAIAPEAVEDYLRRTIDPNARLVSLSPLGSVGRLKGLGYGYPLRASFQVGSEERELVVRTMCPDPFGHDRRADRLGVLALAFDTYSKAPRHVAARDFGVFDANGSMISIPSGEPFLVTDYEEGELYSSFLQRCAAAGEAPQVEKDRAAALATHLAELHAQQASPDSYVRSVRDTVGQGEGIFGLSDSYPPEHELITPERLERFELAAVRWRWKLRAFTHRARRTHGDFHPFNILFREGADFTILDASRGGRGDPADDVTCLSINYLFFALAFGRRDFSGAMRTLWNVFWSTYLDRTGDHELVRVVAPFYAWRILVLASPRWYPSISDELRDRLMRFGERLLDGERFAPEDVDALLR